MTASIRPEAPADAAGIRALLLRSFVTQPGVADMVDAIRASPEAEPGLALVADLDDLVVGFVMLSRAAVLGDAGARRAVLTLSPLAVEPDHQRRGIGAELVRAVLAAAEMTASVPRTVLLEGSPAYYARFGFTDARQDGIRFDLPEWAPPEAGQILRLTGADPALRGRVEYPPAFALAG